MKNYTINLIAILTILILMLGCQFSFGQVVNSITIEPSNPGPNDAVFIVSDFSYNGNCSEGLITGHIIYNGSMITILPEYCGYGDATTCNAVDTFSLGQLPVGDYTVNIEYHQGTICGGNFDILIANSETTFQVSSSLSIRSIKQIDNEIKVYPNPTWDFIKIEHNEPIRAIKLFELTGKELRITLIDNEVDIRSFNSGLYLLDIQFENGVRVTKKIIKK